MLPVSKSPLIKGQMGMLLKFGKDHPTKIWMKNVKQPLDIIYIKDNQIIDLFKNAIPDLGDGILFFLFSIFMS